MFNQEIHLHWVILLALSTIIVLVIMFTKIPLVTFIKYKTVEDGVHERYRTDRPELGLCFYDYFNFFPDCFF